MDEKKAGHDFGHFFHDLLYKHKQDEQSPDRADKPIRISVEDAVKVFVQLNPEFAGQEKSLVKHAKKKHPFGFEFDKQKWTALKAKTSPVS